MSPSQRRAVRALVALGIAAVVWWSLEAVLRATHDRVPFEITCADYMKSKPAAKWLRLTHCEPDLTNGHVVIEKTSSKATNVYVVLRPAGNKQASNIVLQRDDSAMLELASKEDSRRDLTAAIPVPRIGLDPAPDDHPAPALDPVTLKIIDELQGPQEGMITEPSSKTRDEIAGFNIGIDDEFTVLEHGKKPDSTLGLLGLFLALVAAALLVRDIVVSRPIERAIFTIRS